MNLLAAVARVRPEVDLWPQLRGLTAAFLVDRDGQISGAIVALHAVDADAAGRIADEVLPRLASAYARAGKPAAVGPDGVRPLGAVDGQPLSARRRGASVVVGWGEGALEVAQGACEKQERSAGAALRAGWGGSPPRRAGGFWPGRYGRLVPPGSPLAAALAEAPPVVWEGRSDAGSAHDVVRWAGSRDAIRRFLDALPLAPPPDR